ncbi:hypothetical protein M758_4G190200 [Ceratodon purpureus]|nr:hypothetical protein M758_4G190200 [Ceratodon purpureus]
MPCIAMASCGTATVSKLLWPSSSSLTRHSPVVQVSCSVSSNQPGSQQCSGESGSVTGGGVGRREVLLGGVSAGMVFGMGSGDAEAYTQVEVGAFLPAVEGEAGFVQFVASPKDTPALRAGNVPLYKFILPPTWKQVRIANILSGNYCQPKCAEPWVEVKFESPKEGTVQVVASPMVRLTNKPNATIEEIGPPEKIISALGQFVTGNSYDADELLETTVDKKDDMTYYRYQLETPFALTGSHNLATATAKGNVVLLFVVSANDKQWASSQELLKKVLRSFSA